MNILSKLFGSEPASCEGRLASCIDTLSQHVGTEWSHILSRFRSRLPTVFGTASPDERYCFLREPDSLYGGMGSLNDLLLTSAGDQARDELYTAVQGGLREAWRTLGREHHAAHPRLYPVGSTVRLIPGRTRYLERDGSPCVVGETSPETRHVWRIVQQDRPDITNMPQYTINHGSIHKLARHDSLALS